MSIAGNFLGIVIGAVIVGSLLSLPLFFVGYPLAGAIVWILGCLVGGGTAFGLELPYLIKYYDDLR